MSGIIGGAGSRSGVVGETEIDYEEGSWTPVLDSSSADSIDAYDEQVGRYTKVGNLVTAMAFINGGTKGTVAGNVMRVSGLPFPPNGVVSYSACAIGYWNNFDLGTSNLLGIVYSSNSFVYLFKTTNNNGSTQVVPGEINNDCHISLTAIYNTNS